MQTALNQKHAEMVEQRAQLEAQLAAKDAEVQQYRSLLAGESEKAKGLLDAQATVAQELRAAKEAAATAEKVRAAAKFNLLAEFDEGLLRTDLSGDDFTAYLEKMSGKLKSERQDAQAKTLQGAVPPSGGAREPALTKAQVMMEISAALQNNDQVAYQAAYQKLMDIKE